MLAETGEEIIPLRGHRLECRHAGDMHRRFGRLRVKEDRVGHGKTVHDEPPTARATLVCVAFSAFRQCPAISSTSSGIRAWGRK